MDTKESLINQVREWRDAIENEDMFVEHVCGDADECDFYDAIDRFVSDEILDIAFTVGLDCKVREVEVLVALGGPNIYVKTDGTNVTVEGYWGSDSYTTQGRDNIGLFNYIREIYGC